MWDRRRVLSLPQHTCKTSFGMLPYLVFVVLAIPQLSRRVWRRRGQCNVSQLYWVHPEVSMKRALCPLQLESLSHWKGADWELREKNRVK